jgi:hypothetical protein
MRSRLMRIGAYSLGLAIALISVAMWSWQRVSCGATPEIDGSTLRSRGSPLVC